LRHFELPFMDIFDIRTKQEPDRELLLELIQDIQRIVSQIPEKVANEKYAKREPTHKSDFSYTQIHKASTVFRTARPPVLSIPLESTQETPT